MPDRKRFYIKVYPDFIPLEYEKGTRNASTREAREMIEQIERHTDNVSFCEVVFEEDEEE